ncbi:TetR/AcrR family transcriptional regulator [Pseudomaricurvus alkylphenolicus]|jgi:AcrR family transcriptional regulator|uniref:TetR/AcrR family transcriptional regulator n=1 Tax=Pseudomaricurvus alkylphenolicus TaxID=1306991 RepID=UPI001422B624|nr:TetR/AcrR family transcriptional regulator [Pseudomaricurvus alkylphenolicus]NIB41762.1 TetR/AcrR family transcriptional regulator [Pseudomaricurvus alkylphenolicus]
MTATPKTKRGEMTRQKILAAAQKEIGTKGFALASVSSITAAAGVGQGTFYIYFKSKEEVLRALVIQLGRDVRHSLTAATEQASSRLEAERQGISAFLDFVRENKEMYKVVHEAQFVDPEIHRQYYTDFAEAYCERLKKASSDGEIKSIDHEACAWALMGMSEFLGMRYGFWDDSKSSKKIADAVFNMIETGLKK